MQCPAMNASNEEWDKYYNYRWQLIADDEKKPEWLRNFAKLQIR